MADAQTAAGPAPVVSKEGEVQAKVDGLLKMLEITRHQATAAYLETLLRDRDKEWVANVARAETVYRKMGMMDAAKLICPGCAKGELPLRAKPDEKVAATWTHHPQKEGKPDLTVGIFCTAAMIHETLEAKA